MDRREAQAGIRFEPALESDIPEMNRVMARAFDDDSRRFRGIPTGGPPGYDTGDFLRKWMPLGTGYKVLRDGRIIGCFIVFTGLSDADLNYLGTVFLDPDHQGQGIGAQTLAFIHESFPARRWRLETPEWATRNHHFYEKSGYHRVEERLDEESGITVYVYERVAE